MSNFECPYFDFKYWMGPKCFGLMVCNQDKGALKLVKIVESDRNAKGSAWFIPGLISKIKQVKFSIEVLIWRTPFLFGWKDRGKRSKTTGGNFGA